MGKKLPALDIPITLEDKFSRKFAKIQKNIHNVGKSMTKMGKTMSTRLTAPIVALGVIATRVFVGFDDSMRKVKAITGATGEQFKTMTALAEQMGRQTKFTASQSAEAMTFLGMAGLNTEQIMAALPETLQLAAAGGLELAEAADIATNVMTSMGLEVKDLAHINDVLASAASNANTDILGLSEAMVPVAGFASSMGVPLETLVSLLGKMADAGNKGSKAGRQLRNAMVKFVETGRDISTFTKSIDEIKKSGIGGTRVLEIFGKVGGLAVLDLMKSGTKNLEAFDKSLVNSGGTAKRMADEMEGGIGGVMRRLKSAFEGVAITIGRTLEPVLVRVAGKLEKITKKFQNLSPRTQKIILMIAALVAAIGPLLIVLGTMATLVAAISWPVMAVVAGIALFIAGIALFIAGVMLLYKWWDKLSGPAKIFLAILLPFPVLIVLIAKNFGKIKTAIGSLMSSGPMQAFIKVLKGAAKMAKSKLGKFIFKDDGPTTELGARALANQVQNSTTTKNTTNTSNIKIDLTGAKAASAKVTHSGGPFELNIDRGMAFSR